MTSAGITKGILLCGLAVLSACTDGLPRNNNSNSDQFTVVQKGEELTGTYDPAGFTELKIRDLLKFDCPTQRLADYTETPGPRTLITFTATCAA